MKEVALSDRTSERTDSLSDVLAVSRILEESRTHSGESLVDLSARSPVLLVFLRHAGCSFCREALADIARARPDIEGGGTRIVLVHMGDLGPPDSLLQQLGLSDLDLISDPNRELYRAFGLRRGTLQQLFGPKVFWRGLVSGVLARYGIAPAITDATQMPATFLIRNSAIVRHYRHRSAADRPDYAALCVYDASPV